MVSDLHIETGCVRLSQARSESLVNVTRVARVDVFKELVWSLLSKKGVII